MECKSIKKSTIVQLQTLVEFIEEHPEFARGNVVFGSNKMSVEEQWRILVKKLNALGPPVRTIVEWKKSWADLKSRTKKKIADNKKSLQETGGGCYRMSSLSELEQIVDRTLFLSKAAAPSGKIFGGQKKPNATTESASTMESCFEKLVATPPRSSKAVAVITPSPQRNYSNEKPTENIIELSCDDFILNTEPQRQRHALEEESPVCSSAMKRKMNCDQISLIRRQIKISELAASTAREQAEATKALVVATNRLADAAEAQTEAAKKSAETNEQILKCFEAFFRSQGSGFD